uniref:AP-5 complex subunit mu-1 n=1 Tax=Oncorhynchus mykiss TaxID=8022 RepID=A0A8C7QY91_ONCMY
MSVRALWIISYERGESVAVRFSRRYPTVEQRAKCMAGSLYVSVPEDGTVLQLLLTELGLSDSDKPYMALRDDCLHQQRSPALELHVEGPSGGVLWPMLVISQGPLILACLAVVDAPADPRPPLICPLGTPLDIPQPGASSASAMPTPAGTQKQPAWKTGVHRGRAVVNVALTEMVRSMQYGNRNRQDLWDVYGTVTCKCEVEGVLPNVTVTLTLPPNGSPLMDVLVHPCVSSLDASVLTAMSVEDCDSSSFSGPYKFPFSPPLEPFRLCSYTSQVPVPPILGTYQLKDDDNQLRITVSLKLHESVRNSFEYCEAHLPFFNRDQMGSVDVKVSSGQLEVSKEKNLLVWVLGQKFPKSREVSLEGSVSFSGELPGPTDPLCTDLTAYIKLYFRVPDLTLSGCCVDQHSVQVYSSAKPRIVTSRELLSSEYFIWNSTGTAPVSSGHMML